MKALLHIDLNDLGQIEALPELLAARTPEKLGEIYRQCRSLEAIHKNNSETQWDYDTERSDGWAARRR